MHGPDADLPLVTVVTPSYNQGRFIAATIESVLSQDYPNLEYLILDGASTDDTARVAARYADRLTFISEPDRGQSDAINKGFKRARGKIVAWLNSDDVFLPGAIRAAVDALRARPDAALVYGEGYQIDEAGNVISRFAATEPRFNLWRLLNLSDFILQQTAFFRRSIFDEVGWLDEDLHYGMDWEIFMRIGLHAPVVYIPHEMGAIREYAAAKSFSGGTKRARELAAVMRRHTGKRFPPGMFVYGLPPYAEAVNERLERLLRGPLKPLLPKVQRRVTHYAHRIAGEVLRHAQGWYSDEWAGRRARFTFPPSHGRALVVDLEVPDWLPFERQTIRFLHADHVFASESFAKGRFRFPVMPPRRSWNGPMTVTLEAARTFRAGPPDGRRLAYLLHDIAFEGT